MDSCEFISYLLDALDEELIHLNKSIQESGCVIINSTNNINNNNNNNDNNNYDDDIDNNNDQDNLIIDID